MLWHVANLTLAAMLLVTGPARAQEPTTPAEKQGALPPAPPAQIDENPAPLAPSQTLTDELKQSDGVIWPQEVAPPTPDNVLPPPDQGTAVTPVIPPPAEEALVPPPVDEPSGQSPRP